jgi:hypothetical protein
MEMEVPYFPRFFSKLLGAAKNRAGDGKLGQRRFRNRRLKKGIEKLTQTIRSPNMVVSRSKMGIGHNNNSVFPKIKINFFYSPQYYFVGVPELLGDEWMD